MEPYITVADAEIYFGERLNSDVWEDSSESDKLKALITSTRAIDTLNYIGTKTDEDQERQFPRDDETTIPTGIETATCECAIALLDGVDPEVEFENVMMVSQGYANIRSTFDRTTIQEHLIYGIPSSTAWKYLMPFLVDDKSFEIKRVS